MARGSDGLARHSYCRDNGRAGQQVNSYFSRNLCKNDGSGPLPFGGTRLFPKAQVILLRLIGGFLNDVSVVEPTVRGAVAACGERGDVGPAGNVVGPVKTQ